MFAVAVLLCGASLAWAATSGPDPFPTHWGATGTADSWRARGSALALLTATAGGVAALFAVLAACTSAIPDGLINLPPTSRSYWLSPEHRPGLDALLQRFLLTIGTGVLLLLALTVVGTIVSTGGNPVLAVAVWVFLAVIVISVGHLLWRLVRPPAATLGR